MNAIKTFLLMTISSTLLAQSTFPYEGSNEHSSLEKFSDWHSWLYEDKYDLETWWNDPRNLEEFSLATFYANTIPESIDPLLYKHFQSFETDESIIQEFVLCFSSIHQILHPYSYTLIKLSDEEKEELERLQEKANELKREGGQSFLEGVVDAAAAGISATHGVWPLAAYEGYKAQDHIREGCKKYNEGTDYQEKSDKLRGRDSDKDRSNKDEEDRHWWEFWK